MALATLETTRSATSALPAKAWLVVVLLCVVGCLNYLDRIMITTMRTSIVADMPMTDAQFGLLTSVFLWVYGGLSPLAGFMADRFNRSRVIVGSLFVWSVVTWLTAYATTFPQLLATRALMGISEACYIPAALALIADYHRGSTRSLATGIHMAGIMAGQSLGFLGGYIADHWHWNTAFSTLGGLGVGYAVLLALLLRDAPRQLDSPEAQKLPEAGEIHFGAALKDLFRRPKFWLALSFWGLLGVANWLVLAWLPTYFKEQFSLSQTQAGIYGTAYFHAAALVGVLIGGFWADRWSRTNIRGRMLVPAIGFCLAAPAIFLASSTSLLVAAVAGFMVYALTRTFADANMMPILCQITDPRYRATGYGILNLFSCVVGGLGIYAGGSLRDGHVNLSLLFQLASVLLVLCAVLVYGIKPEKTERR
ncbi:spinster family MFS transporter [Fibrella aquatilis]|uniref:MFS transporter n=1 Tax=Fibrella aquatilis TaxID=2817059 RepID=A0A939G6R0_9BACT|nr:MFS transporter [Fibrella aquatilis]MBO0931649.1 MFS transporter [Fibrella aquatilis]